MSLSVTALPDRPAIQIQRSLGGGGFQVRASPHESGAIFDAIQACLHGNACDRGTRYEGDAMAGASAIGLDQLTGQADTAAHVEPARVFVHKEDDRIVLRFVTDKRSASLDLDEEEARNVLVALREVTRELICREGKA